MKTAWQTPVVVLLGIVNFALVQIVGNEPALGITAPWLTIVLIPVLALGVTLAANQLKAIGSAVPPVPPKPTQ